MDPLKATSVNGPGIDWLPQQPCLSRLKGLVVRGDGGHLFSAAAADAGSGDCILHSILFALSSCLPPPPASTQRVQTWQP